MNTRMPLLTALLAAAKKCPRLFQRCTFSTSTSRM